MYGDAVDFYSLQDEGYARLLAHVWVCTDYSHDTVNGAIHTCDFVLELLWFVEVEWSSLPIEGVNGVGVGEQLGQEWLKHIHQVCGGRNMNEWQKISVE